MEVGGRGSTWPGLSGVWVSGWGGAAKMSTHRPGLKRQAFILSVLEARNPRSRGPKSLGGCEGESGPAPVQALPAALGPWLCSLLPSSRVLLPCLCPLLSVVRTLTGFRGRPNPGCTRLHPRPSYVCKPHFQIRAPVRPHPNPPGASCSRERAPAWGRGTGPVPATDPATDPALTPPAPGSARSRGTRPWAATRYARSCTTRSKSGATSHP